MLKGLRDQTNFFKSANKPKRQSKINKLYKTTCHSPDILFDKNKINQQLLNQAHSYLTQLFDTCLYKLDSIAPSHHTIKFKSPKKIDPNSYQYRIANIYKLPHSNKNRNQLILNTSLEWYDESFRTTKSANTRACSPLCKTPNKSTSPYNARDQSPISTNKIRKQKDHIPLYKRYKEEIELKNKRLEILREKNKNLKQEVEVEIRPLKKVNKKEVNEFWIGQQVWQLLSQLYYKRNLNRQDHIKALKKESEQSVVFSHIPQILQTSKNLAKKYVSQNIDVESRLQFHKSLKEEKIKKLSEALKPSFKPEISKRSKDLAKNRKKKKDQSFFKQN